MRTDAEGYMRAGTCARACIPTPVHMRCERTRRLYALIRACMQVHKYSQQDFTSARMHSDSCALCTVHTHARVRGACMRVYPRVSACMRVFPRVSACICVRIERHAYSQEPNEPPMYDTCKYDMRGRAHHPTQFLSLCMHEYACVCACASARASMRAHAYPTCVSTNVGALQRTVGCLHVR